MQHNFGITHFTVGPVYIPLDPGDCVCAAQCKKWQTTFMTSLISHVIYTTNEECSSIRCNISDSPAQSVTLYVSPCNDPPSLQLNIIVNGNTQNIDTNGNQTTVLSDIAADLKITIWHFDYSMDVEVSISNYPMATIAHAQRNLLSQ